MIRMLRHWLEGLTVAGAMFPVQCASGDAGPNSECTPVIKDKRDVSVGVANLDQLGEGAIADVEPRDDGCAAYERGVVDVAVEEADDRNTFRIVLQRVDDPGKVPGEIVVDALRLGDPQHAFAGEVSRS